MDGWDFNRQKWVGLNRVGKAIQVKTAHLRIEFSVLLEHGIYTMGVEGLKLGRWDVSPMSLD